MKKSLLHEKKTGINQNFSLNSFFDKNARFQLEKKTYERRHNKQMNIFCSMK